MQKAFLGWRIVGCLLFTVSVMYGIGIYSFAIIAKPVVEQFGWGRGVLGGMVSAFWVAAPLAPLVGLLVERYGIRRIAIAGALIEGLSLIAVSMVSSLWQFYALRALMGVGKIALAVSFPIAASYWFTKRLGTAIGTILIGVHIGGMLWPPITQLLINAYGWRIAVIVLGISLIFMVLSAIGIIYRVERPEEIGQLPDGRIEDLTTASIQVVSPNERSAGLTLIQAARTPTLWLIVFASMLFYFGYVGIQVQQFSIFTDLGISTQSAANLMSFSEGCAILSVIGFGIIIDRWDSKRVAIVAMLVLVTSVGTLTLANGQSGMNLFYAISMFLGVAVGAGDVVWITLLRRCFGASGYERIYSTWYVTCLATMFSAPILIGSLYDRFGSYKPAYIVVMLGCVVGIVLVSRARQPAY